METIAYESDKQERKDIYRKQTLDYRVLMPDKPNTLASIMFFFYKNNSIMSAVYALQNLFISS